VPLRDEIVAASQVVKACSRWNGSGRGANTAGTLRHGNCDFDAIRKALRSNQMTWIGTWRNPGQMLLIMATEVMHQTS